MLVGSDLDGKPISIDLASHVAIAGSTRSGKSSLFRLLLIDSLMAGSEIYLCDITGLLGYHKAPLKSLKYASDPAAIIALLKEVEKAINDRLEVMQAKGIDAWEGQRIALLIEEFPTLIACLELAESDSKNVLVKEFRRRLAGIILGGLKTGVSVVLIAQRFDADIITGLIRAQFATRICFRSDRAGVRMLLEDSEAQLPSLESVPAGVAVLGEIGQKTQLIRFYYLPYSEYLQVISRFSGEGKPESTASDIGLGEYKNSSRTAANGRELEA